ncbi:FAD-dependent thymidylate synthase [Desulfotruncus arcticus]|uniref:FAD-dependent thymidylate synthase n=1 Tax=Desulfotruncus arcticus TaxID=341036 RepID=UPI001EE40EA1|nr:FAD-dependent thymidylate synthase [Desulfotruncus arcticus]
MSLIDCTPLDVIKKAAAMPYQSPESEELIGRVWDSGHRSIARHGMASFLVEGVSQSLLRQLSRHPHINLTVKSSRYCSFEDTLYIVPPYVKPEDRLDYSKDLNTLAAIYERWNKDKRGYSTEHSREISKMLLPLGATTDLIISGNFQGLYEFLQLRLCLRAEWEIRGLAYEMAEILKDQMPVIFSGLGCRGDERGYCPESHGRCGKHSQKAA